MFEACYYGRIKMQRLNIHSSALLVKLEESHEKLLYQILLCAREISLAIALKGFLFSKFSSK